MMICYAPLFVYPCEHPSMFKLLSLWILFSFKNWSSRTCLSLKDVEQYPLYWPKSFCALIISLNLSVSFSSCVSFSPAGDRFYRLLNIVVCEHIALLTLGDCRREKCHRIVTQPSCQCIQSQYHRALTELYHAQYTLTPAMNVSVSWTDHCRRGGMMNWPMISDGYKHTNFIVW